MPGAGDRLPHHDPTPASAKAMALGRASTCLICSQPTPAPTVPPGLASLPPPPETRLSSQTSPRGLVNPLDHKEKDPRPFPTAPLLLSRGVQGPSVLLSVPRAPPPGGRWGPKHGPLFGRAGGVGFAAGVCRSFPAGNRRVRAGGEGGGARSPRRPNFAWCFVEAPCDLAPAGSSWRPTLHGKRFLAPPPPPDPGPATPPPL
uniref:Uncharacterized protein n=1 Tax=Rousettus aegyptiacus TaxID=9407 RepID=A0A7J8BRW9_ROUAE|nr:hypothetical protein HJG63_009644 [Rousettus aegyptiacus]